MDSPSRGGAERYAFTPLFHTTAQLDHAVGDAHEAALKTARPTTPKYSFPKDIRSFRGLNQPLNVHPPPSTYHNESKHSTLGRTFDSKISSPALTRFSTSTRLLEQPMRGSPGPAGYDGSRIGATRPSTPTWGVGTSRRLEIDSRHVHTHTGVWGQRKRLETPMPGPLESSLGRQSISHRPSSASMRFGSSSRARLARSVAPGPATYAAEAIDCLAGGASTSQRPRSPVTRFGHDGRTWHGGSFVPDRMGPPPVPSAPGGDGGLGPKYAPDFSRASTRPKSPQWSFGHSSREGFGSPFPPAFRARPRSAAAGSRVSPSSSSYATGGGGNNAAGGSPPSSPASRRPLGGATPSPPSLASRPASASSSPGTRAAVQAARPPQRDASLPELPRTAPQSPAAASTEQQQQQQQRHTPRLDAPSPAQHSAPAVPSARGSSPRAPAPEPAHGNDAPPAASAEAAHPSEAAAAHAPPADHVPPAAEGHAEHPAAEHGAHDAPAPPSSEAEHAAPHADGGEHVASAWIAETVRAGLEAIGAGHHHHAPPEGSGEH